MRGARRGRRGSSLILVLSVLTLLAMVMAVFAQLVITNMGQTRRRANALYAVQLAHSGIDWARATAQAGRELQGRTLRLEGGEVEVKVEERDGGKHVTALGRVLQDGTALDVREETLDIGVSPAASAPPIAPPGMPTAMPTPVPYEPPQIGVPIPIGR